MKAPIADWNVHRSPLGYQKTLVLEQLRNGRKIAIDEAEAWAAVTATIHSIRIPGERKADQKRWADECVLRLGLIFAQYTDTLPGFTNCQSETRFERFVRAVVVGDAPIHVSRNLIKAAIRRLDAKRNPLFTQYPRAEHPPHTAGDATSPPVCETTAH